MLEPFEYLLLKHLHLLSSHLLKLLFVLLVLLDEGTDQVDLFH